MLHQDTHRRNAVAVQDPEKPVKHFRHPAAFPRGSNTYQHRCNIRTLYSLSSFRHYALVISRLDVFQRPQEVLLRILQRRCIRLLAGLQIRMDELDQTVEVFRGDLQVQSSACACINEGVFLSLPPRFAGRSNIHIGSRFQRTAQQTLQCPYKHLRPAVLVGGTLVHAYRRGRAVASVRRMS